MSNFYDFIQDYVFSTDHHLNIVYFRDRADLGLDPAEWLHFASKHFRAFF